MRLALPEHASRVSDKLAYVPNRTDSAMHDGSGGRDVSALSITQTGACCRTSNFGNSAQLARRIDTTRHQKA